MNTHINMTGRNKKVQPSPRDSSVSELDPGIQTPGYCRLSLRDMPERFS